MERQFNSADSQDINLNIKLASSLLAANEVTTPEVDARILAAYVLNVSLPALTLEKFFSLNELVLFKELVNIRAKGIPVQYLIGTVQFGPIELAVRPGVFIPRPETEVLLELVLIQLEQFEIRTPLVIDCGTGTGALALALAHQVENLQVIGIDNSELAIALATENLTKINCAKGSSCKFIKIDFNNSNMLADLVSSVDILVANPPYVPVNQSVAKEVSYDPVAAVFAKDNGLAALKALRNQAQRLLKPKGWFGMEHDAGHAAQVFRLFNEGNDFYEVISRTDWTNRVRFITGYKS